MFDKQSIFNIVKKYFRQGNSKQVNMMHDSDKMANGVYLIESFIIDSERGISTPKGFEKMSEGSWFGTFKVDNDKIWQDYIKSGVFKGFSVEGNFKPEQVEENEDETLLNKIKDILNS